MHDGLGPVFAEVVLICRLTVTSSPSNCVWVMPRNMPKLKHACVAVGSFSGGDGNVGCWKDPSPDGLFNEDARSIAMEIAKQSRLLFLQSGSSHEGRSCAKPHWLTYIFDKYDGSTDVANEVAQYLINMLHLNQDIVIGCVSARFDIGSSLRFGCQRKQIRKQTTTAVACHVANGYANETINKYVEDHTHIYIYI